MDNGELQLIPRHQQRTKTSGVYKSKTPNFSHNDMTMSGRFRVRFFGRILKRICDLRSFGSWCIKGTDESLSRVDSSVPLMHHDPNDLRSQIRFWILPKKRTLNFSRLSCHTRLISVPSREDSPSIKNNSSTSVIHCSDSSTHRPCRYS